MTHEVGCNVPTFVMKIPVAETDGEDSLVYRPYDLQRLVGLRSSSTECDPVGKALFTVLFTSCSTISGK